jgi:hypothetical protein
MSQYSNVKHYIYEFSKLAVKTDLSLEYMDIFLVLLAYVQ